LGGVIGWRVMGEKILPRRFRRGDYFQKLGIKKEQVRTISLSQQGKAVELKRDGELWKTKGKKAKEMEVNELLAVLFPQNPPEIVAKTSSRHQQMGVDEAGAIKIKLNGEKEIWLGKNTSGGNYLRFPEGDEVWLVKGVWYSPTVEFSYWVDKTIISLDTTKLKKIDWRGSSQIKVYEKKDNSWWEGEKRVGEKKIEPIITGLSLLIAEEVIENQRPEGYSQSPKTTLEIEWEGGSEKFEFFPGKEDKYLVKRGSDSQEFLISSETAKKFLEI